MSKHEYRHYTTKETGNRKFEVLLTVEMVRTMVCALVLGVCMRAAFPSDVRMRAAFFSDVRMRAVILWLVYACRASSDVRMCAAFVWRAYVCRSRRLTCRWTWAN